MVFNLGKRIPFFEQLGPGVRSCANAFLSGHVLCDVF